MEQKIVTRKKAIGSYYSPDLYASAMVRWAMNSEPRAILDPSYGGCVFLDAAFQFLQSRVVEPGALIYGADLDEDTDVWSRRLVENGTPPENLVRRDFLSMRAGVDLPQVPAVVGNPPYVRHHLLSQGSVESATSALAASGLRLNGRSSLWAYFVLHASGFVLPGGRMAFLLPGTMLNADYAKDVIAYLRGAYGQVDLVRLGERIFPDAEEETVVLLATDRGGSPTRYAVQDVATYEEFANLLERLPDPSTDQTEVHGNPNDWKFNLLDRDCQVLVRRLTSDQRVRTLGDMATISIGTVTGANSFFVVSDEEEQALGLGRHALSVPVLARSAYLTRPLFTSKQFDGISEDGVRARLLTLPKDYPLDRRTSLGRRVDAGELEGLHRRRHCNRSPWWSLDHVPIPDAFLPYMGGSYRGLSANTARAASTNAIHHVNWKPGVEPKVAAAATLSSWSVLTSLCAELYGRQYGGGVLKLELSAASRLPVLRESRLSDSELMAPNNAADARVSADTLLKGELELSSDEIELLARNLNVLHSRRRIPRATA